MRSLSFVVAVCASVASFAQPNLTPNDPWPEVGALTRDGRMAEALKLVEQKLAAARTAKDDVMIGRALVRAADLRMAQGQLEEAVSFLRGQQWPDELKARTAVQLTYASTVEAWSRQYRYELGRRTRVEGKGDPSTWTSGQAAEEVNAAYLALFAQREALGAMRVDELSDYVAPNTYPREVRGTARDLVTYLFTAVLLDRASWSVDDETNAELQLLPALLASPIDVKTVSALDVHPLRRAAALFDDLERFHAAAGRKEAGFEARRVRITSLAPHFTEEEEQAALRADLDRALAGVKGLPWWSMGKATLASMIEGEDSKRAHALFVEGERAFPTSAGGLLCRSQRERMELPQLQLSAMSVDSAGKRSLMVSHANLTVLHLRAYRFDLEARIAAKGESELVPQEQELERLIAKDKPVASWTEALPKTTDFRAHRTYVTPPLTQKGTYLVLASTQPKFARDVAEVVGVVLTISDLHVLTAGSPDGRLVARVVSGETGAPIPGVQVRALSMSWGSGRYVQHGSVTTDATGRATFGKFASNRHYQMSLLAKRGADFAFAQEVSLPYDSQEVNADTAALIYTDRSIYRPGQELKFKVVVFRYDWRGKLSYEVRPNQKLTLTLNDANGQVAGKLALRTNRFGSASGTLKLPEGRRLGHWALNANIGNASTSIRVEAYKRPTFESRFEPGGELRLNQPAKLTGTSRYYFGEPLRGATVKWTVVRQPGYHRHHWGYRPPESETVLASGTTKTGDDGKFSFDFVPRADEKRVRAYKLLYRYRVVATVMDDGGESQPVERIFPIGIASVSANITADREFFLEGVAPTQVVVTRTTVDGAPRAGKGSWLLSELQAPSDAMLPADLPAKDPFEGSPGKPRRGTEERTPGDVLAPRWTPLPERAELLRAWVDKKRVATGELIHADDGRAEVVLPRLAAGIYRLSYLTADEKGEEVTVAQELLVASAHFRPKLAQLLAVEVGSVEVGGVARLLVTTGLTKQPLELEILRRDGSIERRALEDSAAVIEIPITSKDQGGLAISLSAVRDHQALLQTAQLDVPFEGRDVEVSFSTFRDQLKPGVKETWRVSVKSPNGGAPVAAEVLAYMYDRSLDVFGPHSSPSASAYVPQAPEALYWKTTVETASAFTVFYLPRQASPGPELFEDALLGHGRYAVGGPGSRNVESKRRAQTIQVIRGGAEPEKARASSLGMSGVGDGGGGRAASPKADESEAPRRKDSGAEVRPSAGEQAATVIRSNFSESAFFRPHLLTDADGTVSIEFTPPDAVTEWSVWAHAITKDVKSGVAYAKAKTSKDLLIRPYVPRFFREGDQAELRVVINNASAAQMKGELLLELLDPATQRSVAASWGLKSQRASFTVPPKSASTLTFSVTAPRTVGDVAFKAVGTAGSWTDGELRVLPVLPSRLHLSQSRFVVLKGAGEKALVFDELEKAGDLKKQSEQLVLTVDAQLFDSVLAALPYLIEYPYECTEQTLNRFLSAGIVSSVLKRYPNIAKQAAAVAKQRGTPLESFDRPDANRKAQLEEAPWLVEAKGGEVGRGARMARVLDSQVASAERDRALRQLREMQNADGGFPWFPRGPSSLYMTLYLLNGFSRGVEYGLPIPRELVHRGWGFVAAQLRAKNSAELASKDAPPEWLTLLAYAWTGYPDASWLQGGVSEADIDSVVDRSFTHWRTQSPYLKSMLATTLARRGRQADGRTVFESVMDSAKSDERLGVYWAQEDKSWLWYRDTIETHAMALSTLSVLSPKDARRSGLVQWLFLNKKLNQWKSTRATAEVIYALVKYLDSEGQLGVTERPTVTVTTPTKSFAFAPDKGAQRGQWVVPGELVTAPTRVSVSKPTRGVVFTSATWHFATDELPAKGDGDLLAVSRAYFRRTVEGTKHTLVPLAPGASVQVGDEVEVEVRLKALHEAEYVHLRDPRGAGFEPVSSQSSFKWEGGLGFFEEVRDTGENFFFERLPVGEYTLRYRLRASMGGVFRVGPAAAQSMYAPEFTAYSAGTTLGVKQ